MENKNSQSFFLFYALLSRDNTEADWGQFWWRKQFWGKFETEVKMTD